MFLGLFLVFLAGIVWNAEGVGVSYCAAKKLSYDLVQGWLYLFCLLFSLIFSSCTNDFSANTSGVLLEVFLCTLLAGVLNFISFALAERAMSKGPHGLVWGILQAGMCGSFLMGVFCFHEYAAPVRVSGLLLIIAGIFAMGHSKNTSGKKVYRKEWLPVALLAFLFVALTQCFAALPSFVPAYAKTSVIFRSIGLYGGSLLAFAVFSMPKQIRQHNFGSKALFIIVGVLILEKLLVNYLLLYPGIDILAKHQAGGLGYPLATGVCLSVFSLYSLFILKEKISKIGIFGLCIVLIGIVLISLKPKTEENNRRKNMRHKISYLENAAKNENRRCRIVQLTQLGKLPKGCNRKQQIARADKICKGFILFDNVGVTEEIFVGKRKIDWRKASPRDHQEFFAQLSRFFMLEPLQNAWIITGDEKYPARARELIEDYLDLVEKEPTDFTDFQNSNLLNVSLRLNSWGRAILNFRDSESFDPAFVQRILKEYARSATMLNIKTVPGISNWQIAQSGALVTASIRFDMLPGAAEWRKHGCEVLGECFQRQFRPSGVHNENTYGYHTWMLSELSNFYNLQNQWPLPELKISGKLFRGALDFMVVARRFCNNDVPQFKKFPVVDNSVNDAMKRAEKVGLKDYKPPVAMVFVDSGLVYGGNAKEQFFFDAAQYVGYHTHWNRLVFEYVLDDFAVIPDLGITTYDHIADPNGFQAGRSATTHATVNFSGLEQVTKDAKLLEHRLSSDFVTALGEFNAGYGKFAGPVVVQKTVDTAFRRRVTWLPGEYMLVFDRTSSPVSDLEIRAVWPVLPVKSFKTEGLRFTGINEKMPSVLIEMIVPAPKTTLSVASGKEKTKRPGWNTVLGKGLPSAPELTFAAPATTKPTTTVTLIAARSAGQTLPVYKVKTSVPGMLVIALPQGGKDEYTWNEDLTGFKLKRFDAAGKISAEK